MTRLFTFLTFILLLSFCNSCTTQTCCGAGLAGNWVTQSDFDGIARTEAVSFVIDTLAYVGTGTNGANYMNDFWQYNATAGTAGSWKQCASLPGDGRASAVAFSIGNKGYVGTGFNGTNKLNDFWSYDPILNTWTRKADFIGSARSNAIGFAINNKGYITTGNDGSNDLNDFYEYDTTTASWTKDADMPGLKRSGAIAFVYQNKAYICTGSANGVYVNDMWMFDPSTASWTAKRPITNVSVDTYDDSYGSTLIVRNNAAAFVIGSYGYLCTGENNGTILKTVWEYNFNTDLWNEKQPWNGVERTGAIGFAVEGRGSVALGNNSKYYFDDMREFKPF